MDSRQVDRLIAEHLMGMECWQAHNGVWRVVISERTKGGRHWPRPRALPFYSSTWEGMGLVVKAMRGRGWWCRITSPFYAEADVKKPNEGWYWGGFTPLGTSGWNGRPDHQAGDDEGPMAVALAALKALGVEMAA